MEMDIKKMDEGTEELQEIRGRDLLLDEISSSFDHLMILAMRITGNHHDAEDLVQETMCRAIGRLHLYRRDSNMQGWLATMLRNLYINGYRKTCKYTFVKKDDLSPILDITHNVSRNNGESLLTLSVLENLVENLNDYLREPFKLYLDGFQYEEIAQQLQRPLGTVKSQIFKAKRELRSRIDLSSF